MEMKANLRLYVLLGVASTIAASWWSWQNFVVAPIEKAKLDLKNAEKKRADTQGKLVEARSAKLEVAELSTFSLSESTTRAQEEYQAYLVQLLQGSRITQSTISPGSVVDQSGISFVTFSVQGQCDQDSFLKFLHSFYLAPQLQQIRRLSLNPLESADMQPTIRFDLTLEAAAFSDTEKPAKAETPLPARVQTDERVYRSFVDRNVLYARPPTTLSLAGNSPDYVVFVGLVEVEGETVADIYDQAVNTSRRVKKGESLTVGAITGKVIDLGRRDMVLEMDGELWVWPLGVSFNRRRTLSVEAGLDREIDKRLVSGNQR